MVCFSSSQLVSSRLTNFKVHWPWADNSLWWCMCQVHWVPRQSPVEHLFSRAMFTAGWSWDSLYLPVYCRQAVPSVRADAPSSTSWLDVNLRWVLFMSEKMSFSRFPRLFRLPGFGRRAELNIVVARPWKTVSDLSFLTIINSVCSRSTAKHTTGHHPVSLLHSLPPPRHRRHLPFASVFQSFLYIVVCFLHCFLFLFFSFLVVLSLFLVCFTFAFFFILLFITFISFCTLK